MRVWCATPDPIREGLPPANRRETTMKTPAPSPCVITRFDDDGSVVATYTQTRDPIRVNEREPDVVVRRFVVLAEQETGETQHVGYAATRAQADAICDAHMASHPEHRSCWFERI